MTPAIILVAALARGGIIGRGNGLPWRLPEDLRRFKQLTTGHGVVMGRRTWESLGRPLPARTNIVLSRDPGWSAAGAWPAADLDAAVGIAAYAHPGLPVMVIGGALIYALALPRAQQLRLTEIELDVPDGDAVFPPFDRTEWREASRTAGAAADGTRFAFVDYLRVS